jgi:hypothetical protein
MEKAFDIRPPQRRLPILESTKDYSIPKVQGQSLHWPETPKTSFWRSFGQVLPRQPIKIHLPLHWPFSTEKIFIIIKNGFIYLGVGLLSFVLFSGLFWGYNRYQEKRTAALNESAVSGQSTQLNSALPTIRLLNASGQSERVETMKDLIGRDGLEIRAVSSASQLSSKTIIYYRTSAEELALRLAQLLTNFSPAIEKNDDIAGLDDIVILIGISPANLNADGL